MEDRPLWDPSDDDEQVDPTEGVRLIGADEAAEAVERGEVATRRGDGTPRYGDRPSGPDDARRPTLRFPPPRRMVATTPWPPIPVSISVTPSSRNRWATKAAVGPSSIVTSGFAWR